MTTRSPLCHFNSRSFDRDFQVTFFLNVALHSALVAVMAYLVTRRAQNKPWAIDEGLFSDILSLKFNLLPTSVLKVYMRLSCT